MNTSPLYSHHIRRAIESPVMTAFNRREAERRARERRREWCSVALGAGAASLVLAVWFILCR